MREVFLRNANIFDAITIADIKNYHITKTDVIFANTIVYSSDIAKDIEENKNNYIVAECEKEVVGYACLMDYRGGGYFITKEVSIHIKEGFVGLGVGNFLVEAIITKGKLLGLSTLVSYINSINSKNISLFKKNGFEVKGELQNVATKNNNYVNVSILQVQLK